MSTHWEKFKQSLNQPLSERAMEEAAKAFNDHLKDQAHRGVGLGSKVNNGSPVLVLLSNDGDKISKPYPNAIKVKDIPVELSKNPEFLRLMKKIVK